MSLLESYKVAKAHLQALHVGIVASGKLCDACSKISFQPLYQTGYAFRPNADPQVVKDYEHRLFYFHHCCIACVNKASIAGCRLCAFFLTRLRINVNRETDNKLGSALLLPGAGVWVVLTQRSNGKVLATDGRLFAARSDQTNWASEFTFHYDKIAASVDLVSLPCKWQRYALERLLTRAANLVSTYEQYPERPRNNERYEDSSTGLSASIQIAKAWYETCHDKDWGHVSCRPFGTEFQTLPTRVIDVGTTHNPRVKLFVTRGYKCQYLALSYCWGQAPQRTVLLKKNLDEPRVWEHVGLPQRNLSRTIRDAILVTRNLGFRYLWVDALCIVQDDDDDKNKQFAVMGDIYRKSALTIAAATGSTADSGLFVHRDPLGRRPCPVYEEQGGHNSIMFAQLPTENIVETPLDSRGWVFQEDMLATRTLKFLPDGLRWSCASFWMSESTPTLNFHPSARPHTILREWLHQPNWKPSHQEALDMQRHFFEDWYEAVASYTDRELTKSSDKLPALAGLAQSMRSLRGCTYLQGLWEEDLEYGLLWYVGNPLRANRMNDALLSNEHYRVVAMSGGKIVPTVLRPTTPPKKVDFMDTAGMTPTQEFWLALKFLSCEDKFEAPNVPSWSWASLQQASIRFLYGPMGLSAQGTPMAKCLRVKYNKGARRNSFVAARGGHMVLQGALKKVVVVPGRPVPCNSEYSNESMGRGKWSASLFYREVPHEYKGVLAGYTALDEDPEESDLLYKTLTVLLMRDDTKEPSGDDMYTTSGYMKKRSLAPLSIPFTRAAMMAKDEQRRYTTALLLRKAGPYDAEVYRRVGLCQMHHWIWQEELGDPKKRESVVVIV